MILGQRRRPDAEQRHQRDVGVRGRPARRGQSIDRRASQERVAIDQVRQDLLAGAGVRARHAAAGQAPLSLTIPGSPTGGPTGKNQGVYHDDLFSGEIGQIGTQLDGLGHVGVRVDGDDTFYNGFKRSQFGTAYGLEKLGIENVGVFFTRGVLVDVAAARGVGRMKSGEVITARDLEAATKAEGVAIGDGDVVVIRTGHGQLWMKDNAAFSAGEPGIGMEAGAGYATTRSSWSAPTPGRPRSSPPKTPTDPSPFISCCSLATGFITSKTLTSKNWPETRHTNSRSSSHHYGSRGDRLTRQSDRGSIGESA